MTDPSPRPDFLELADYTGVLRRRGWIALALAGLGALVAMIYLTVAPASYQATASVYVTPNAANQNVVVGSKSTSTSVNMDNEAQIVQSNTVAVLAARTLHSRLPPQDLLRQVSVSVPANTAVLAIGCSAPAPASAAACAQAFARGYLAARHATAANKLASELTQEQSKADGLQARSVTLHDEIGRLKAGTAARAQAMLELKTVSAKLDTLNTNISAINASVNTNPGYIITSAEPPSSASSPLPLLYLPSGLLAGLLAGLVAAFAADRRDDRVHTVREAERLDQRPVVFAGEGRRTAPPEAVAPARSAAGRGYAELAAAVAAGLGEKDRVLLIAGCSAGPAAGVVAANVAASLARVRADVILVCADLRDTMTPSLLGVGEAAHGRPQGRARGLAEVLGGTATVAEVTRQAADVSRLEVITPGMDPAAAPGQVRHDVAERLVGTLRRDARYVLICLQATGDGADTFGLAEFADSALVVLELERTRRPELAACLRRLDRVRTEVMGVAVLPEIGMERGPRLGLDRGLRLGRERGHRSGAGGEVPPAARRPGTRSLPSPRSRSSEGQGSRTAHAGRAAGVLAETDRSRGPGPAVHGPSGRRPAISSRSSRPQPRWEPAEPPPAQPPWDADDSAWGAGGAPPVDPLWEPEDLVDREPRRGQASSGRREPSWDPDGRDGATPAEPRRAPGEPGRPEAPRGQGGGPSRPPRPEQPLGSGRPSRTEAPRGPGRPPEAEPDQPFQVQPPWGSTKTSRPEQPRSGSAYPEPSRGPGSGPAHPESPHSTPSGPAHPETARRPAHPETARGPASGSTYSEPPRSPAGGQGRQEPPWGDSAPSWSEPVWPDAAPSWPEPMWSGTDPSRSEPAGGTADPSKSEAPGRPAPPDRSGPLPPLPLPPWPARPGRPGSWDQGGPREPGRQGSRPADPPGRAAGNG